MEYRCSCTAPTKDKNNPYYDRPYKLKVTCYIISCNAKIYYCTRHKNITQKRANQLNKPITFFNI